MMKIVIMVMEMGKHVEVILTGVALASLLIVMMMVMVMWIMKAVEKGVTMHIA